MTAQRIGVIGFGFSGLMVVSNLVRLAAPQTTIYIVGENLQAQGVAYGTRNVQHLLNVPTAKMGAYPDALEDFFHWLGTPDAALTKQQLHLTVAYGAGDFVPRALYGAYLQSVWLATQQLASERQVFLKLVETTATAIAVREPLAILTLRGDAIAVDRVVLATGNEQRPVLPELTQGVIQNPWAPGAFDGARDWASPVALMGAGLTAVDVVLSLREAGYTGEIIAFSRHGLMPQAHAPANRIFTFDAPQLLAQPTLSALVKYIRTAIAAQGEWRPVIDALRPHTQALWQRIGARAQLRFLARLMAVWNVHRHRMAPQIASVIRSEIAAGTLRILASSSHNARMEEGQPLLTLRMSDAGSASDTAQTPRSYELRPSRIVNCTGPQLAVGKSAATLYKQALADGLVEPHATGIGIAVDPQLRAWGAAYPNLYAMGALTSGQLLESTAVPELRAQALQIAQAMVAATG